MVLAVFTPVQLKLFKEDSLFRGPGPNFHMYMGGEFATQHQAFLWTPAASFYSTQLCHPLPGNNIISQRLGLSTTRQPPLSHPSLKLEVQIIYSRASQVVLVVKNVPAKEGDTEMPVQSLVWKIPWSSK